MKNNYNEARVIKDHKTEKYIFFYFDDEALVKRIELTDQELTQLVWKEKQNEITKK